MRDGRTTWLIIEPEFVGHHFVYLREIVNGAIARKIPVVIAVGEDVQGEQTAARLNSVFTPESFSLIRVTPPSDRSRLPGPLGLIRRALSWWKFLSRAYAHAAESHQIDFVFVPYLDHALFAVSVLGSPFRDAPFGGLTMRQRFHLREMGVHASTTGGLGIKKALFVRALRLKRLQRMYVIDDTLPAYMQRSYPELASKVVFMPDPVPPLVAIPKTRARQILGLPAEATIILAFGYLDSRKGIGRLLDWAMALESAPPVYVVLAGSLSTDVEQLTVGEAAKRLRMQHRLSVIDRYIEANEEPLLFCAADAVWLGYENVELQSGVLVTAAHLRKAVLFSDYGLIGRYAKLHGATQRSPTSPPLDASKLPPGIEIRYFDAEAPMLRSLPDHSWTNATRLIYGS